MNPVTHSVHMCKYQWFNSTEQARPRVLFKCGFTNVRENQETGYLLSVIMALWWRCGWKLQGQVHHPSFINRRRGRFTSRRRQSGLPLNCKWMATDMNNSQPRADKHGEKSIFTSQKGRTAGARGDWDGCCFPQGRLGAEGSSGFVTLLHHACCQGLADSVQRVIP